MDNISRFAVDSMLGKLAKWLRLIGYDTFYRENIKPVTLLSVAQSEGRVLVTRRRFFLKHPFPVPVIFLHADTIKNQLQEINNLYELTTEKAFTRCSLCNSKITFIDKKYVKNLVPEYVFRTHNKFSQCIRCGKIYWKGTHIERAMGWLKKVEL